MVKQHELRAPPGARRERRRRGRGDSSGRGSYSGRGRKGQQARSGKGPRPGFEGGQLPLVLRLPTMGGFRNPNRKEYAIVKLEQLERHFEAGAQVTPERMVEEGLLRNLKRPVKVLSNGAVTKALSVSAHGFSASAREKILAAGGAVSVIGEAAKTKPVGQGEKNGSG